MDQQFLECVSVSATVLQRAIVAVKYADHLSAPSLSDSFLSKETPRR